MIRLGIVGTNYGRTVQLPAFRADPRCQVVALAGSDAAPHRRACPRAPASPRAMAIGARWSRISDVQAVAIATLPSLQAQIAIRALELGKPVFVEKPMAGDLAGARAMLRQATHEPAADHDRFQLPSDHDLAARQAQCSMPAPSARCAMSW